MPFQAQIEKDFKVRVPPDYVKGMNLHEGDFLTLDVVPLMGQKSYQQLETELGYAQEYEISMQTLHHFIPIWMPNFKANLPLFVEGAKSYVDIEPVEGAKKKCVIVANGPSMYATDLSPLKNFNGTIVSTNKPLKHLLECGVVPDWVAVLDAGPEVFDSFNHDIVREFARASNFKGVLIPTVVDNRVAKFAVENFSRDKCFWSNPHFSDAIAPNVCETLTSITTIPSCEHGGNVGTFAYLMAIRPLLCNPMGLLGFDLSYPLNPAWSQEDTTHYRFFYLPEKDTDGPTLPRNAVYAMTQPFEYYVNRLMDLWNTSSEKMATRTYNLTPSGPLNAVIGLPRASLLDFCSGEE